MAGVEVALPYRSNRERLKHLRRGNRQWWQECRWCKSDTPIVELALGGSAAL